MKENIEDLFKAPLDGSVNVVGEISVAEKEAYEKLIKASTIKREDDKEVSK